MSSDLRLAADVPPLAHVRAWLGAPELAELVVAFGGQPPNPADTPAVQLAELDAFSDRWDYRAGRERNEAGDRELTGPQLEAIDRAARVLGQLDLAPPARREWNHVIILGGLLRACLSRPAVAAEFVERGEIEAQEVTGLGALRPLNAGERTLAEKLPDLFPGGAMPLDELEAMTLGLRRAFSLDGIFDERGERHASIETSWRERLYRESGETAFRVVAAPAPAPGRRATTPQALAWFGATKHLRPGTTVLIITTEIYRHYHLVDGIRTLGSPFGAIIDCVGISPADADERLAMDFTPTSRVQEIRSSIRALRSLIGDLA